MMKRRLETLGVGLMAVEQPIDVSSPEQVPLEMFYMGMPEAENRRRGLNNRRGIQRAHVEGKWVHTPPVGYLKQYDGRGRPYLVPDPETGPLIQKAFRLMASGHFSIDEVRRQVRRRDRRMLYNSRYRFGQMLRNAAYLGLVRVAAADGAEERWVQGQHEPLVDQPCSRRCSGYWTG